MIQQGSFFYKGYIKQVGNVDITFAIPHKLNGPVKICLERKMFPENVKKGDSFIYYIYRDNGNCFGKILSPMKPRSREALKT